MNKKRVELLAPAGSLEKAKIAFSFGADAIYIGIPLYSLRAKENKFTLDEAKKITKFAHSINKKVYFTTNIYFHNFKIPAFKNHVKEISELNPDALIVSDPGIIHYLKKEYPNLPLHLSVQANSTNYLSVNFWKQVGISRVILPRELTLKEIKEIIQKNKDIETEIFIHGSICISYSGRCLISNYLNYRDANQGLCNNSCRWKYKLYKTNKDPENFNLSMKDPFYKPLKGRYFIEEALRKGELFEVEENSEGTYILNSKDLCAIEFLDEIIETGVNSLKIEGRNKSEYYLAIVLRAYREALDLIYNNKDPDYEYLLKELSTTSNRGFIPGFLKGNLKALSQNYERTSLCNTHCYLGIVRSKKILNNKTIIKVDLKNKLIKGDKLDIIEPYKKNKSFIVTSIKVKDKEVNHFSSGTQELVELEVPYILDSDCILLRKQLN